MRGNNHYFLRTRMNAHSSRPKLASLMSALLRMGFVATPRIARPAPTNAVWDLNPRALRERNGAAQGNGGRAGLPNGKGGNALACGLGLLVQQGTLAQVPNGTLQHPLHLRILSRQQPEVLVVATRSDSTPRTTW